RHVPGLQTKASRYRLKVTNGNLTLTGALPVGVVASNFASTVWSAFIVTVHGLLAPQPPPVKVVNREPAAGAAVNVTCVPSATVVLAPCAQEGARRVEFVNAVVAEVRGVDAPARVDRNTLRGIELAAQSALAAREAAGRDGADPNAGTADVLAPCAQEVARRV